MLGYVEAAKVGGTAMSLDRAYKRMSENAVLYWLGLPTLILAQVLGCGVTDPKYYRPYTDANSHKINGNGDMSNV